MEQYYDNATNQTYNWTSSSSTTETPEQSMVYWTIYIIVTFVVATIATYILSAFIYKEISFTQRRQKAEGKTSIKLMRMIKISMAFFVFINSITHASFKILSLFGNPDYCYIEELATGTVSTIGSFNIYVIFWLRQRLLYKNPVLEDLTNVITRTLSATAIIIIVIWHIGIGVTFSRVPFIHEIVNYKCKLMVSGTITSLVWISLLVTVALLQSILLFLFLHPLYKHRIESKWMKNKNMADLLPVMQRAFAGTLAFVISGAVINMTGGFVRHDWIGPILHSIGQLRDLVIVTMSFSDWKQTVLFRRTERAGESATVRSHTMKSTVRISLSVIAKPKADPME